ncbi:MAG: hypothetical protein ACT4O9_03650 [Blastocatellia bacterium]
MYTKIYIAAAILLSAAIGYSLWSSYQIRRLEEVVEAAKTEAAQKQKHADELESRSRVYEEKIAYLEKNINEIKTIARKQDEELQKINVGVSSARGDVLRARRVRTAAANVGELCAKLAELGYPCE